MATKKQHNDGVLVDSLGRPKAPLEFDDMVSFRLTSAQHAKLRLMVAVRQAKTPNVHVTKGQVIREAIFGPDDEQEA